MARMIDADRLADGLKLHRQPTDQKHEADRQWAVGYNAGLDRALHSIAYAPTLTQPNEPLTLEKLENMEDTTPVWWDQINSWVLVYKGNLTTWSGKHLYAKGCNGKFYRRPPEGEEETP